MSRTTLTTTLATLAAGAALVPAAMAATDDGTTVDAVEIEGAYAFVDRFSTDPTRYAAVVFRTDEALPRRAKDGMIRAGGRLDGTGSSVSSVRGRRGKAADCYQIPVRFQDGRIAGPDGRSAKIGSKHEHELEVSARGSAGSDEVTVRLDRKRDGHRSGRRLGC